MPVDLKAHERVLESIRQYDPETVADGPVVPARYATAHPRVLWVLRETHGGGDWDLREFLGHDSKLFSYPSWHSTFGALAKISHGLIRSLPAAAIERLSARSAVDALRDVAVINVNKRGGERNVDWDTFPGDVQDFRSFVDMQIATLDAEILIAAGTADLLPDSLRADSKELQHRKIGAVRISDSGWLVKCYHTAQTRIPHHELYRQIVDALYASGWRNDAT